MPRKKVEFVEKVGAPVKPEAFVPALRLLEKNFYGLVPFIHELIKSHNAIKDRVKVLEEAAEANKTRLILPGD